MSKYCFLKYKCDIMQGLKLPCRDLENVREILKLPCKCTHEILKLPCSAKLIALQSAIHPCHEPFLTNPPLAWIQYSYESFNIHKFWG
jgi:hypothetical protein